MCLAWILCRHPLGLYLFRPQVRCLWNDACIYPSFSLCASGLPTPPWPVSSQFCFFRSPHITRSRHIVSSNIHLNLLVQKLFPYSHLSRREGPQGCYVIRHWRGLFGSGTLLTHLSRLGLYWDIYLVHNVCFERKVWSLHIITWCNHSSHSVHTY